MRVAVLLSVILQLLRVEGYFTIVGSRTFLFGSEYQVFLTQNHEFRSNVKLELELEGEKSQASWPKSIILDSLEQIVTFDVS